MGTGYTRNDTANNIADGNVINASDLDGEFDAVQAAFNGTTGHSHDGTSGEGPQIDTAGIAADAVTNAKIADDSIDSEHYVDGSIDTAHIANDAVTGDKLANNIQIAGTLGVTGETTLSTHLNMGDNDIIKLGASADLQLFHDGSNSYVKDVGTGSLILTSDGVGVNIQKGTTEIMAQFVADGANIFKYDNSTKLQTTATGATVTGELVADTVDATTLQIGNTSITATATELNYNDISTLGGVQASKTVTADSNGWVNFPDNQRLRFGTGVDLQIYHNASNSYITDTGTGNLLIGADGSCRIQNNAHTENMAIFRHNGAVTLYYDNAAKLDTKSDGVDITGELQADSLDIDGVGDISGVLTLHSDLNMQDGDRIKLGDSDDLQIYHNGTNSYIQDAGTGPLLIGGSGSVQIMDGGFTETMGYFEHNGAVTLYHNNSAKLATKSDGVDITGELQSDSLDVDGAADISGQVNFHSNVVMDDNNQLIIGNGSDLKIYHNGSASYIAENGTGSLFIQGSNLTLENSGGTNYIVCTSGGAVALYYNGTSKLQTKSDGVNIGGELQATSLDINGNADISGQLTMGGNINLQDNDYLQLGSSQDLQIYHDGGDSIIKDNGTGSLYIDGSSTINFRSGDGGEYYAVFNDDGKVSLRYNNVEKFATASDGITVTGNITGVTDLYVADQIFHTGDTDTYTQFHAANQWRVVTGGTEMLEVNDSYINLGANSKGSVHTASVTGNSTPNFYVYNSFVWTLTGNITLANPSTEQPGMSGVFVFVHSGAGRTVSLGTDYETAGAAGLTLSGTSGAVDIVPYFVQATGNILLGTPQLAFS